MNRSVLADMHARMKSLEQHDVVWLARMWSCFHVLRDWRGTLIWPIWYLGPASNGNYTACETAQAWINAWEQTHGPMIAAVQLDIDKIAEDVNYGHEGPVTHMRWLIANIQRHYVLGQHLESALYRYKLRQLLQEHPHT